MFQDPKQANIHQNRADTGHTIPDSLPKHEGIHLDRISKVSIVLPLHNEAENIKHLCVEILDCLRASYYEPKILLIDDGSTDDSLQIASQLSLEFNEVEYISFSRNFGKEAALMAGINEVDNDFDALAYMDSDGQHDPNDLVRMLEVLKATGCSLVCGARVHRAYQSTGQRFASKLFYLFFRALTDSKIEEGVGDFNVMTPKVVGALRELKEEYPFMKGLVSWVGFEKEIVPITVRPRAGGQAKSSTIKLARLALGAFLSFSSWPLRTWSLVGIASAIIALTYLLFVVLNTILFGRDVPGYASTIVLLLGLGGLQLLSVGILGEYIARIYDATKNRPRYLINQRSKSSDKE